ncbi:MAG: hypothetical protein AAFP13_09500 [Pseudomonadota bacterium]
MKPTMTDADLPTRGLAHPSAPRDGATAAAVNTARTAFATRDHAAFLRAFGWHIPATPRHDSLHHAPGRCCLVLRNAHAEEAAFGFTGLALPHDTSCRSLAAAKAGVADILHRLGEDRGLLLQNRPLLAFGGRRRDQVLLFGGWRFRQGTWRPFVLGPGGLAGLDDQERAFDSHASPSDLAEAYGRPTAIVMPHVTKLVNAIDQLAVRMAGSEDPGDRQRHVRLEAQGDGWFAATPGARRRVIYPLARAVPADAGPVARTQRDSVAEDILRHFGEDELKFRKSEERAG